jgi:hypothetical protein
MATPAHDLRIGAVHFLRLPIAYTDNGVAKTIGVIPAGSLVLKALSGLHVTTVFNAGTNNFIDIGTSADDDLFGTDLSGTTATFVPLDEAVGTFYCAAETTVTVTVGLTGTAATTGAAVAFITYIPNPALYA